MKRLLLPASTAMCALLLMGCEKVREAKNAYSAVVTTTKAAKEMG